MSFDHFILDVHGRKTDDGDKANTSPAHYSKRLVAAQTDFLRTQLTVTSKRVLK